MGREREKIVVYVYQAFECIRLCVLAGVVYESLEKTTRVDETKQTKYVGNKS